jgi:hypothetical protein
MFLLIATYVNLKTFLIIVFYPHNQIRILFKSIIQIYSSIEINLQQFQIIYAKQSVIVFNFCKNVNCIVKI